MKIKEVYLDNASTTPIDQKVLDVMAPYLNEWYGNPSSLHELGRRNKNAIEKSRNNIARCICAEPNEIIFTSGGTEADNLAIFGLARANKEKGKHIIVSSIEHKAILDSCKKLEREGFSVTYLDVDKNGRVSLEQLRKSIRPDTILVSIMYANNEIGTIQPIRKIARIIRHARNDLVARPPGGEEINLVRLAKVVSSTAKHEEKNDVAKRTHNMYPIFHSDACQATGALPIDVKKLGVDAMTISASKIYGPKGIGCLYLNKKYSVDPIIVGGGQERGMRSGTENVAYIVGFSEALLISIKKRFSENKRLTKLRNYFLSQLKKGISGLLVNGSMKNHLPNNINVSIKGVEGESLVLLLDEKGVSCSTGSACSSMDLNPSHVLIGIGLPLELAHCSVRFTLGRYTKKTTIDYTMRILIECVEKVRSISTIKI